MFEALFVCSGNVCRSPMAERLAAGRTSLEPGELRLASAGTRALAGQPMDAASAAVLRELGGDPSRHIARQLLPSSVARADLILTASAAQRAVVVRDFPEVVRRTFTLREFARLGSSLPTAALVAPGALDQRVAEVAARRGFVPPAAPGEDEIPDPFGAPMPSVRACGQLISDTVDAVLAVLGLSA